VKLDTDFVLAIELTASPCEWGQFEQSGHEQCYTLSSLVVLDTTNTRDPAYPEGFHDCHLCPEHAVQALFAVYRKDVPA
jgi:hypothetical protein